MSANLLLLAVFVASMLLMSMNHQKKRRKIVFLGDAITIQGMQPGGYIRILHNILEEAGVHDNYVLTAVAVSGDKIDDLYLRLDEEVLAVGSDVAMIFISTNSVWHRVIDPTVSNIARFEAFYDAVIGKLLTAGIRVILCTPAPFSENTAFQTNDDVEMECYCNLVRNLAAKYDLPLVDIHKAFMEYLVYNNPENKEQGVLTTGRGYLSYKGHQLVAKEMWTVLQNVK